MHSKLGCARLDGSALAAEWPELWMRRLIGGRDGADLRIRGFSPQAVDGGVKPNSDIHFVHFGRCLKEQGIPAARELAVQRSHFLVDLIHHIVA